MASTHPSQPASAAPGTPGVVLLFDGVCNLCNGAVNFIIDRDPEGVVRFASLQSEAAQPLLRQAGLEGTYLDSLVLLVGENSYVKSDAALEVARRLRGPWPVLYAFRWIPRPMRDAVYDWIARNRYAWFGRRDTCRIPTPELRARFLEWDSLI